jgi:hypothetical protein
MNRGRRGEKIFHGADDYGQAKGSSLLLTIADVFDMHEHETETADDVEQTCHVH